MEMLWTHSWARGKARRAHGRTAAIPSSRGIGRDGRRREAELTIE